MITKIQWERLVNKQEMLKKELELGFELDKKKLFDEIMFIEGQLVLLEN